MSGVFNKYTVYTILTMYIIVYGYIAVRHDMYYMLSTSLNKHEKVVITDNVPSPPPPNASGPFHCVTSHPSVLYYVTHGREQCNHHSNIVICDVIVFT